MRKIIIHLLPLVVVVERQNESKAITTAYRNRNAMRKVKRKAKRFSGSWHNTIAGGEPTTLVMSAAASVSSVRDGREA
jgi:hypothetical protein